MLDSRGDTVEQGRRFRIIRDSDENCPYCGQAHLMNGRYKGVPSFKCGNCAAILIKVGFYYSFKPKDRKNFENFDEIKAISLDNQAYRCKCAEERRKIELEQREEAKKRREEQEELRAQKRQIKVDKEYGDGPLGNLPKQRKRGFYS